MTRNNGWHYLMIVFITTAVLYFHNLFGDISLEDLARCTRGAPSTIKNIFKSKDVTILFHHKNNYWSRLRTVGVRANYHSLTGISF